MAKAEEIESGPDAHEIGARFVASGGKRLRSRMLEAVFTSLAPASDPRLVRLSQAIEILHKATLVHDDIQDNENTRYGRPTVWREHGVGVAIAVGDLMMAEALRLVAESGFGNVGDMLAEVSRAMVELRTGQADELTGRSDYLTICRRKTGSLFALAAALGALAAKADPAPYRAWGEVYGILFQIRDDLADCGESPALRAHEREYARILATDHADMPDGF